jgi:hypothetical protein
MRARSKSTREGDLSEALASLNSLTVKQLKERWQNLYVSKAPPDASRELLTRAVAYRLQERAHGGLTASTRRLLERLGRDLEARSPTRVASRRKPAVGTTLLREWGGAPHRVTVLDDGVVYCGKRYRSLSEVARAITGTRWSGPRFFGLNEHAKEESDGAH